MAASGEKRTRSASIYPSLVGTNKNCVDVGPIMGTLHRSQRAESTRYEMKIDEFLNNYDFCASYDIRISASPSVVYERLLWLDFNDVWIVRLLETARTGKLVSPSRLAGSAYFLKARRVVL